MSLHSGITTAETSGTSRLSDIEVVRQFRDAMAEHGLQPDEVVPDGKLRRFDGPDERRGKRSAWCVLYGDGSPAGSFGDWRTGLVTTWCAKSDRAMTAAERQAHRQRIEQAKAEAAAERARLAEQAATRSRELWNKGADVDDGHAYVVRKGIKPAGAKQLGDALLIPLHDGAGVLRSLQFIQQDGAKRFKTGGTVAGCYSPLGGRPKAGTPILICEGWATACSLRESTGFSVAAAMNAGNLLAVAQALRAKMPDVTLIICADDDAKTPGNPGLNKAREAARAVGALVAVPDFGPEPLDGETDFNDLHVRQGAQAVSNIVQRALSPACIILLPTVADASGAAYAEGCLLRLEAVVSEQDGNPARRHPLFSAYASELDLTAKRARQRYPDAELIILAAHEDGAEARNVGELHGASVEVAPAGASWGELLVDRLFAAIEARVETDSAIVAAAAGAIERASAADEGDPDDDTVPGENPFANNRHFRVLGVDGDTYFFFRKGRRNQILTIRTSGLSKNALMSLAPLNWWEGIMQGNFNKDTAVSFLMDAAEAAGIYDPTFTRGRGAWWDADRMVVHLGDRLLVDGTSTELGAIRSEFLYQGGSKIAAPSDTPLSAADGTWLLEMAKSFRWAKPASAPLLCGWLLLSPLCGALRWRPHAWITGGAGSGKTTILNEFVRPLIPAGMDVFANGDSTEAGLRQTLRSDARPILIDESESDTETAATKMQRILVMIRQSSSDTGAQTFRGTVGGEAQAFQVRSMALLSSIGVALERQQDLERVTVLALRPKREGEATDVKNWPAIRAGLNKITKDKTLSARLFRRSIDMAPVIMESIDVFTEAAANVLGTQREGDQIGVLLAGGWCLVNDRLPTPDEARAEIKRYDWGDYQEGRAEEQDDLIATLMGRPVTRQGGGRISVGKLVARAAGYAVDELDILPAAADSELHNVGMKVKDGFLWFHPKNAELLKLMRETKFSSDLRGRLKRIQGASTKDGIRIGEAATSGILIPLRAALSHRDSDEHMF